MIYQVISKESINLIFITILNNMKFYHSVDKLREVLAIQKHLRFCVHQQVVGKRLRIARNLCPREVVL